jgi:hypothetical protein
VAWTPGQRPRVAGRMGVSPASIMAMVVVASFGRVGGNGCSDGWLGHGSGGA